MRSRLLSRLILLLTLPVTSLAVSAHAQYNVANASNYAGADIGAQINNAFHASGGTPANPVPSWTVAISAGNVFSFSTPIEIPGDRSATAVRAPVLDCQGSVLLYTGTGDAIIVHGENATGPAQTGAIRNCKLYGPGFEAAGVSLIHIKSRLGFTLANLNLENAQTCLDWENTTADGGPGYNEEDNFEHIQSSGCQNHIRMHSKGDPSFEYNRIDDWHFSFSNGNGSEYGLKLDSDNAVFNTYGGIYDLKANVSTSPTTSPIYMVYVTGANIFSRSVVDLHGENTAGAPSFYSVYIDSGQFVNQGNNTAGAVKGNTSAGDHYVIHPAYMPVNNDAVSDIQTVHIDSENPDFRTCKLDFGPNSGAHVWLAHYGQENDCQFQILARDTDSTNQDVSRANNGAPPVNILYADPQSKAVGIGPGFGTGASGSNQPGATLDVHGNLQVSNPNIGVGGTQGTRIISAAGNIQDTFHGSYPGQPSPYYQQVFYDTTTYQDVLGMQALAFGGNAYYIFRTILTSRGTPSSSTEGCASGETWDDDNYHYHCNGQGVIKRIALQSF